MKNGRISFRIFSVYARALWLALATVTVVSEIAPNPHLSALWFYGFYSPAKLVCFLALGCLTALAFGRVNDLNRGLGFGALSAASIEMLQGVIGNGHSFHWYELVAKLIFLLVGFVIGLDARYERAISLGIIRIALPGEIENRRPA